jgi:hypothetical protein
MVSADSPLIAPEITDEPLVLVILNGSPGEIGFIHHPVALDHYAICRTNLMRINHQGIAHRNLRQRHI